VTSQWFSPGTPVSSTNLTDYRDVSEILFKVALNTINQLNQPTQNMTNVFFSLSKFFPAHFCGTIIVFGRTRTADLLWWYHSTLVLTLDYFNLLTRCIFTDLIIIFFTGFRCYKVTTSKNQSFD
jgi:hypothetical protein